MDLIEVRIPILNISLENTHFHRVRGVKGWKHFAAEIKKRPGLVMIINPFMCKVQYV